MQYHLRGLGTCVAIALFVAVFVGILWGWSHGGDPYLDWESAYLFLAILAAVEAVLTLLIVRALLFAVAQALDLLETMAHGPTETEPAEAEAQ